MDERPATSEPPIEAAPHPLAGLRSTIARLPRYLGLARALVGDRRLSRWRKAALGAGIAYLASPIDLVPGILPVIGQLDDLAAFLLALRVALRGLPGPAGEARLAEAGLSRAVIDEDLANVRRAAGWVARRTGALAGATARHGAAVATRGVRLAAAAGRVGVRAVVTGGRLATRAGRAAGDAARRTRGT